MSRRSSGTVVSTGGASSDPGPSSGRRRHRRPHPSRSPGGGEVRLRMVVRRSPPAARFPSARNRKKNSDRLFRIAYNRSSPEGATVARIAIVTGASRGLGLALTRRLVAGRMDRRRRRAGRTPSPTRSPLGPRAVAVAGDVTDPDHRRELVATARRLGDGRIDLLVNNAGGLGPSPCPGSTTTPSPALGELFDVNVVAPLALVQLALPALTRRHDRRHHLRRVGRGVRRLGRVRGDQDGARPPRPGARRRAARRPGAHGRPGRHAHPDAPGRLPRRGHLRPPPPEASCRAWWR